MEAAQVDGMPNRNHLSLRNFKGHIKYVFKEITALINCGSHEHLQVDLHIRSEIYEIPITHTKLYIRYYQITYGTNRKRNTARR